MNVAKNNPNVVETPIRDRLRTALRYTKDAAGHEHAPAGKDNGGQFVGSGNSGGGKAVVNSPEFKAWFGESKVVDENGKPLVVYHGTGKEFTEFDEAKVGQLDHGFHGTGFYFSQNADYASAYAPTSSWGGNVKPVYLSLRNPFYAPSQFTHGDNWREAYGAELKKLGLATDARGVDKTAALKKAGYDGVILRGTDGKMKEIVSFHPSQIKSATGNNGKFNPKDNRITYVRHRLSTLFYRKFAASQSAFSFAGESDDNNDTTSKPGDSKSKKPKTKDDFRAEFERLHPRGPDGKWIKKNDSDKVKPSKARAIVARNPAAKKATSKGNSTTNSPTTLPLFDADTGEANINPDGTLKAKLREALQRAIDTRKDVVSKSSPAISVVHSSTSQPSPEFLDSLTKSRKQLEILAKLKRIDRKADYGIDDFVQDVSILAAKNHTTFDPAKGKFTTWIGRIANNHAISLFRNSKRLKRDSGPMMSISSTWDDNKKGGSSASLADGIADYRGSGDSNNQSEIEAIRSHVENLPKRMRTVIRDRFLNGKSIQEIQKKLGWSRQAVYDAMNDGLQEIRKGMNPDSYQRDKNESTWTTK